MIILYNNLKYTKRTFTNKNLTKPPENLTFFENL